MKYTYDAMVTGEYRNMRIQREHRFHPGDSFVQDGTMYKVVGVEPVEFLADEHAYSSMIVERG